LLIGGVMSSNLEIEVEIKGEYGIFNMKGDVNAFADEAIESAVNTIKTNKCIHLILDFTKVEYINSAGISILIDVITESDEADGKKGKLYAIGLTSHYQKIFKMVGISQYIEQINSKDEIIKG
jgi:anti-sigma B factor antagonist